MRELEILFSSKARPRLLRFFFLNDKNEFSIKELKEKTGIGISTLKKELNLLVKAHFLKKKKKNKGIFFFLNKDFPFFDEFREVFLKFSPLSFEKIKNMFKSQNLYLLVVAGEFLSEEKSPVDLLIVGKKKNPPKKIIKKIEQIYGKEIRWSYLTKKEFDYRFQMRDKFLRDIFDFSHKILIKKEKK